jgi:uncharacterized protein YyaL (SSP411 family)
MGNPVAWQLWGDEAIDLARRENKLLFVSIGYSACHCKLRLVLFTYLLSPDADQIGCHVMERESFENEEVAQILNNDFIPIKIDREERPDIDRIYMNFVQATTGSGGWPLNVFVTPTLEPVFGGTYWPGPHSNTPQLALEDQVDFLGILKKLSSVWKEQEDRCRQDSAQILLQLKEFAAEGTFGGRLGEEADGLDLEILEEAYEHFASTFDRKHSGFGSAPKFPTPTKLSFLLRLSHYPQAVIDIVGAEECARAQHMATSTLRAMARGGIHDHIGHGFARYSVTTDWSLPHFEKMLYDNTQLLHVYLDAFLATSDPEFLGVVYDLAEYLTTDALAAKGGGFYCSEDADSFYRKGDAEKREGAFYVWTSREVDTILGNPAAEICTAFWGISSHGNVSPENDVHDEFINQNVLSIVSTPKSLATQFGMSEEEVVRIIKESRNKLRAHRDTERVRPALDDKIVVGWNGIAIGALARTSAAISTFDLERSERYLLSAKKAGEFIKNSMYNPDQMTLKRVWRDGVAGDTGAFADDYAFLIEGLLDLYEATFEEEWLRWANDLQSMYLPIDLLHGHLANIPTETQRALFFDIGLSTNSPGGGFFATPSNATHTILRLKDGMDTSEPSTNGTSASNLFRLSCLLGDDISEDQQGQCEGGYSERAKETIAAFEAEILQYPWGFGSFMPGVVAGRLGIKGIMVVEGPPLDSPSSSAEGTDDVAIAVATAPRGGLSTILKISPSTSTWLKQRNPLLRNVTFPAAGKVKVLVCENGVCREEGLEEMQGLGLGEEKAKAEAGAEAEAESGVVEGEKMADDKAELVKDGTESAAQEM